MTKRKPRDTDLPVVRVSLKKVKLNKTGYEWVTGLYYGVCETNEFLYYYSFHDPFSNLEESDVLRLTGDREFAKMEIRKKYPTKDVKFYR